MPLFAIHNLKKKLLGRKDNLETSYPIREGIRFVHRNPKLFNIGDFLASPRHYFRFSRALEGATVVGGGIFDPRKNIIKKFCLNPSSCAVWGAGFAQGMNEKETVVTDLPFRAWSYRDMKYVPDDNFVPCVSCFHPLSSIASKGDRTLVFLNDDPKVTPYECRYSVEKICRDRGWLLAWNSSSEKDLLRSFELTNQVITNSFHGSYWGLLSERSVKVIAHNMKFISMFEGMGLEGSSLVHVYGRRDGEGLLENLRCTQAEDFVFLKNAKTMRADFQSRNIKFAKKLVDCGLFDVVELASDNQ